jgi:Ca2+-binding RTX toxin-like protein
MSFHEFHIEEVYSNQDGTIQFVEFLGDANGQEFWSGHTLQVLQSGPTTNTFTFTHNLPVGDATSNKSVLVASQGYADLAALAGLPAPDFIVPNGFLFTAGDIRVFFPSMLGGDTTVFSPPRDGVLSNYFFPGITTGTNSRSNLAGASGVIPLQPFARGTISDTVIGAGQLLNDVLPAGAFINVNGNAIAYSAALILPNASLPGWLSVDSLTGALSGTPAGGDVGTIHVRLTATDNDGSGFDDFDLRVISGHVVEGDGGNNSLAGTAANDSITGLGGNDTLAGDTGFDTLVGGAGNDTYVVTSADGTITEASGQGTDTVLTSITLPSLAANVENLTLALGSDPLNATGNALNNVLTGNDGNNTFDGAGGADTMAGGGGDDTFLVDSASDMVVEALNNGTDLILTAITLPAMAANVENLTLTGGANVSATGNGLDNVMVGNGGNNKLVGGAGNDTLSGGAGDDSLIGGAGNDAFLFSGLSGTDRIVDFNSGADQILLDDAVFTSLGLGAVAANQLQVATIGGISDTSGDADDYLKYATDTGQLYYDDNGATAGGLHLIAVLASPSCTEPHPTLNLSTAQDIVVV